MIQRAARSGAFVFYPRVAEPRTGVRDLDWVEASGRGTVYSTTVVRQKPPAPDYNVALIELAEGPRMMSRVDGIAPAAVKIGMAVRARIVARTMRRWSCSRRWPPGCTNAMQGFPRGKTAIVGAATFGIGKAPGFEAIELAARASLLALAQAGLSRPTSMRCSSRSRRTRSPA